MVCSVTEGEDKPLKYPLMFRACELVLVNKIDLLPHLDFDLDKLLYNIDSGPPRRRADRAAAPGPARASTRGATGWLRIAARAPGGGRCVSGGRSPPTARLQALLDAAHRGERAVLRRREAERLARLCHLMAERFARGGRLVAFGRSPAARSDARHVAVEFVHPVIVGKRALPAIGLAGEGGDLGAPGRAARAPGRHRDRASAPMRTAARPRAALALARARGCLTIAFSPARRRVGVRAADARTRTSARSSSRRSTTCCGSSCTCSSSTAACSRAATRAPRPRRRRVELPVPVPRRARERPRAGARRRAPLGADEGRRGRRAARADADRQRGGAASPRRTRCARASTRGGKLLALGNGGSATDAMDVVADFRAAGRPAAGDRPDRGPGDPDRDRQRHRRRGDLLAPGDRLRRAPATRCWRSRPRATRRNVIEALAEARRRGLLTIAMVGYDGGRVAERGARRPRRRHPLGAHPAHPGGAGERLPRAAGAGGMSVGRRAPRRRRACG